MGATCRVPIKLEHAASPSYSGSETHLTSGLYSETFTASPACLPEEQDRMAG